MIKSRKHGSPVLIYLVELGKDTGFYVHPSRLGIAAGETVWANPSLQFDTFSDAHSFAQAAPDRHVVKLRISAKQEPIRPAKSL